MTAPKPQHPPSVPLTYAACRPDYYVHSLLLFFSPPLRLDRRCCISSATLSSLYCHHIRPWCLADVVGNTPPFLFICAAMTAELFGRGIDHMHEPTRVSGRVWICSTNPYLLRLMPSVVSDDRLIEIHPNPLPACFADSNCNTNPL